MSDFSTILEKLNGFIKKYYLNELLKGIILFIGFGLLIFLLVTSVEFFLWLSSIWRRVLLFVLVGAELYLLYRFVGVPLSYLGRLRKGIDNKTASILIGKHFPQVGDKLTNILDLKSNRESSDLLDASIEQKSKQLGSIPFSSAIDFKGSLRFLKVLSLPILIVIVFAFSGELGSLLDGYKRVKNFDLAYAQPAPFVFNLLTNKLNYLEGEPISIEVETIGEAIPDEMFLNFEGKSYLMKSNGNRFSHEFNSDTESGAFFFTGNGFNSSTYQLNVGVVPIINDFVMYLNYPKYLKRENETLSGTGNGEVPEGTIIKWRLQTENTEKVTYQSNGKRDLFDDDSGMFVLEKSVRDNINYSIITSNENVQSYEELSYRLNVVKDEYPEIKVEQSIDSLSPNVSFYKGRTSDDYGVATTRLVYYQKNMPKIKMTLPISKGSGIGSEFEYTFPSGISVEKDVEYQLYFEVVDNDGIRGGKVARSEVFDATIFGEDDLREKELDSYKSVLKDFQKNINDSKKQEEVLKAINENQKESQSLSFNDKQTIKDFVDKQKAQEEMMKSFSKNLAKDLNKTKENSKFNELLKERLMRQELEAEKNRKLLEELEKVADKIEKEELQNKLEELAKKQSSGKRNLEQLLELTKRYYVTEKANQLANDLENLSKEQELLGQVVEKEPFDEEKQQLLNEKYDKVDKELEELKKDNQALNKPMNIDVKKSTQEGVKKDQQEALEEIQKQGGEEQSSLSDREKENKKSASSKMGAAAKKLQKLSEGLKQSMSMMGGGGSSVAEDAEMLRQILENLITFSFKQEELFDKVSAAGSDLNQTSYAVRKQQELRGLFEHVDDSLFALSLRQPDLSEFVNEQITEVYYNVEKALDNIAENQLYQGASYQQYVLTSSNSLADYLAKLLDNMQQSMMQGQGQGQGSGFQLPDIIKAQQQLGDQMGQISGQRKEGKEQQSGQGKEGGQQGDKNSGKDGKENSNGKDEGKDGQGKGNEGEGESKQGEQGENSSTSGQGYSENQMKEIYEIYKEQQTIRQALEKQLSDMISNSDRQLAKKLVRQMESFENDLLENGITNRTENKMNTIQHELMKLENAAMEQGKKKERESNFNNREYTSPQGRDQYNNKQVSPTIEILNRQALPLRNQIGKKVKGYFENGS